MFVDVGLNSVIIKWTVGFQKSTRTFSRVYVVFQLLTIGQAGETKQHTKKIQFMIIEI